MSKPIDPERIRYIEMVARDLGRIIGDLINSNYPLKTFGFGIVLFSFDGSELSYISNANRADMIRLYEELLTVMRKEAPQTSEGRN